MNFNLINGNIITLDQSNPIANSVTIENDKILNIDNINSKYQNIDLSNKLSYLQQICLSLE